MSPFISLTGAAGIVLLAVALAAVLVRRHYRASYFFGLYLAAVLTGDALTYFWPQRFFVWSFWMLRETLYGALKLGMAVEIARLASQTFPGAAAAIQRAMLAVLAIGLALILAALRAEPGIAALARDVQPRLAETTALVFVVLWALVLWYHLPLHAVHKTILRGLVPYLLVFTLARGLTSSLGWKVSPGANVADVLSYVAVLVYWAVSLWRTPELDSEFIRTLQPWRSRL
jgi:hypothetical protein